MIGQSLLTRVRILPEEAVLKKPSGICHILKKVLGSQFPVSQYFFFKKPITRSRREAI